VTEAVDIDEATRKWIDEVFPRLEELTYYELLGVARDASNKDIRRAYFRIAGTVHPDKFFKKNVGSYKAKIDRVFERMTYAYEELRDESKRKEYDLALGNPPATAPRKAPVDPKVAAERQKAMDALKARFEAGKNEAQKFIDAGAKARAVNDVLGALDAYKRAAILAPNDQNVKRAIAEIETMAQEKLVDSHAKKAALEERFGRWAAAADSWQKVVQARPDDASARERLANALARAATAR